MLFPTLTPQPRSGTKVTLQTSANIYAGSNPGESADTYHRTNPRATGFSTDYTAVTTSDGLWGLDAQDVTFNAIGNVGYTLSGGVDYSVNKGMKAELEN